MIRFFVPGTPAPGGSKNPIPIPDANGPYVRVKDRRRVRIVMADAGGVGNKKWRTAVRRAASEAMGGRPPVDFPLGMRIEFVIGRPKYHFRAGKFADQLKPDAPEFPTVSPDTTKTVRSTEDAINGVVWVDDSRVVRQTADKRYAVGTEPTGAWIEVYGILATDDAMLRGDGQDDAE